MESWYYKIFGAEFGPSTLDELVELARTRTLSATDDVRYGDDGLWIQAGSIEEIAIQLSPKVEAKPAPLPPASKASQSAVKPQSTQSLAPSKSSVVLQSVTSSAVSDSAIDLRPASSFPVSDSTIDLRFAPPAYQGGPDDVAAVHNVVWYYKMLGVEYGPVQFDQLIQLKANSALYKVDEVRFVRFEMGQWCPAEFIGELSSHFPYQSDNSMLAWAHANVVYNQLPMVPGFMPPASPMYGAREADDLWWCKTKWWCKLRGVDYGPIDLAKLFSWGSTGLIRPTDLVRYDDGDFRTAVDLPGLIPASLLSPSGELKVNVSMMPSPEGTSEPVHAAQDAPAPHRTHSDSEPEETQHKPAAKARKSSKETVSIDLVEQFTKLRERLIVPAAAAAGVIFLLTILYLVAPIFLEGKAANVRWLKDLQTAYAEVQSLRKQTGVKKDDFKAASANLKTVAKEIVTEVRGSRTETRRAILSLSKTLLIVAAKNDLTKPVPEEKTAEQQISKLKDRLGVN